MPSDLQRWAAVQLQRIRRDQGEVDYLAALQRAQRDPSYTQELASHAEQGKLMSGVMEWPVELGMAGVGLLPGMQIPMGLAFAGLGGARMLESYQRKQEDLPWKWEMGIGALDPLLGAYSGVKALKKPAQAAAPKITEAFKPTAPEGPLQSLQEQVTANLGPHSATLDANLLRPIIRQEGDQAILRARTDIGDPLPITPSTDPGRYDLNRAGLGVDPRPSANLQTQVETQVGGVFPKEAKVPHKRVPTGEDYPKDFVGSYGETAADPMMAKGPGTVIFDDLKKTWKSQYGQVDEAVLDARANYFRIGKQAQGSSRLKGKEAWSEKLVPGHPLAVSLAHLRKQIDEAYVWDPSYAWPPQMGRGGEELGTPEAGAWINRKTRRLWSDPEGTLSRVQAAKSGPHRWAYGFPMPGAAEHPLQAGAVAATRVGKEAAPSLGAHGAVQQGFPLSGAAATEGRGLGFGRQLELPMDIDPKLRSPQRPPTFRGRTESGEGVAKEGVGRWPFSAPEWMRRGKTMKPSTPWVPTRVAKRKVSELSIRRTMRAIDRDITKVNEMQDVLQRLGGDFKEFQALAPKDAAALPVLLQRLQQNVGRVNMLDDIPANQKYKDWLQSRGIEPGPKRLEGQGVTLEPGGQPVPEIKAGLMRQADLPFEDVVPTGKAPKAAPPNVGARFKGGDYTLKTVKDATGRHPQLKEIPESHLQTLLAKRLKQVADMEARDLTHQNQYHFFKADAAAIRAHLDEVSSRPFEKFEQTLDQATSSPKTAYAPENVSDAALNTEAARDVSQTVARGEGPRRAAGRVVGPRAGMRIEYYARLIQRHMFDPMLATFLTKRGGAELQEALARLGSQGESGAGVFAREELENAGIYEKLSDYVNTPAAKGGGQDWFNQQKQEFVTHLKNEKTLREIIRRTLLPYTPEGQDIWRKLKGTGRTGAEFYRAAGERGFAAKPGGNLSEDLLRTQAEMEQRYDQLIAPDRLPRTSAEARVLHASGDPIAQNDFDQLSALLAADNMNVLHPKQVGDEWRYAMDPDQKAWFMDNMTQFHIDDLGGGISEDDILRRLIDIIDEPIEDITKRLGTEARAQARLSQLAKQKESVRFPRRAGIHQQDWDPGRTAALFPGRTGQPVRLSREAAAVHENVLKDLTSSRQLGQVEKAIHTIARQRTLDTLTEAPGAPGILRYLEKYEVRPEQQGWDALFSSADDVLERITLVANKGLEGASPGETAIFIDDAIKAGKLGPTTQLVEKFGPSVPYGSMAKIYNAALAGARQKKPIGPGARAAQAKGIAYEEGKLDPTAIRRLAVLLLARQSGLAPRQLAALKIGNFTAHVLGEQNAIVSRGVVSVGGREKHQPAIQGAGDYFLNNDTHDAILLMLGNRYGWSRSRGGPPTRATFTMDLSGANADDPLFATTRGRGVTPGTFETDIKALAKQAGVEGDFTRPFQTRFRRWAADHAGSPDMSEAERLELGRLVLGHATTETTKRSYRAKGPPGYKHNLNAAIAQERGVGSVQELREAGAHRTIVGEADRWLDRVVLQENTPIVGTTITGRGTYRGAREREAAEVVQGLRPAVEAATQPPGMTPSSAPRPITQRVGDKNILNVPLFADPALEQADGGMLRLLPIGQRMKHGLTGPGIPPGVTRGTDLYRGANPVDSITQELQRDGLLGPDPRQNKEIITEALAKRGMDEHGTITLPDGSKIRGDTYGAGPEPEFPAISKTTTRGVDPRDYVWADGGRAGGPTRAFFDDLDFSLQQVDSVTLQEPVEKITQAFVAIGRNADLTPAQRIEMDAAVEAFWGEPGRDIRNLVLDKFVLGSEIARVGGEFSHIFGQQIKSIRGSSAIAGNIKESQLLDTGLARLDADSAGVTHALSQGFIPAQAEMRMEGLNLLEDYVRTVLGKVDRKIPLTAGEAGGSYLPKVSFFSSVSGQMQHEPYFWHAMGNARNRRLAMRMTPQQTPKKAKHWKDNYSAIRRLLYSLVPFVVLPTAAAELLGVEA